MCILITQHDATDVTSFKGASSWHADSKNVNQSELNVNFYINILYYFDMLLSI